MQFDEAFNSLISFFDFTKNKDKGQCFGITHLTFSALSLIIFILAHNERLLPTLIPIAIVKVINNFKKLLRRSFYFDFNA